jgi:hypothetical protein
MVEFADARRSHRHELAPGPGRPLDADVRAVLEPRFEHDFSRVRVHADPDAGRIGAMAYTTGEHIGFAPGRYRPGTAAGRRLRSGQFAG